MAAILIKDGVCNMDYTRVAEMLATTYWSPGIKTDEVLKGAQNSAVVVGAFLENGYQIGYARAVSDKIRFAYIMDVIVDDTCRCHGIGQRLIEHLLAHPDLKDVYQWLLRTSDAQAFYQKAGFKPANPANFMEIKLPRPDR